MLKLIVCSSHQIRSPHEIDTNIILQTVFKMFVDLKTGYQPTWRQHRRKAARISALYSYFSEKNESVMSPCSCPVPCTKTRFDPNLSYALLSRKNIERLVIDSYQKETATTGTTFHFGVFYILLFRICVHNYEMQYHASSGS